MPPPQLAVQATRTAIDKNITINAECNWISLTNVNSPGELKQYTGNLGEESQDHRRRRLGSYLPGTEAAGGGG